VLVHIAPSPGRDWQGALFVILLLLLLLVVVLLPCQAEVSQCQLQNIYVACMTTPQHRA
jgi:CDP-diglyceride synthetase